MALNSNAKFMMHALQLAARHLGQVWPNPAVGCVIVKEGAVVGTGWTAIGGRPHAETEALAQAGSDARGATVYVTLEPCAHHGKTPPCAEALVRAGVARVVVACRDPDARVNGQGIALLRAAGIEVVEGVCEAEARELNAGFFSRVLRNRPHVTLKIATSKDRKIAHPPGAKKRWITSEMARHFGQLLRAENDAILTGIGTVLSDDPLLTCRLPGMEQRSPVRVVLDRKGQLPKEAKLLHAGGEAWVLQEENLSAALTTLAERGITRLMVEGGKALTEAFLREGLADALYWFEAPLVIGAEGLPVELGALPAPAREQPLGVDSLRIYSLVKAAH